MSIVLDFIGSQTNTATSSQIMPTFCASDVNGAYDETTLTIANLLKEPDFKSYQSDRQLKRFYKIGKYFEANGTGWVSTSGTVSAAYSPDASTYLRTPVGGSFGASGSVIGAIHVTYYVAFKGG